MHQGPPTDPHASAESPWRPLLHRWFVEYNPAYLLSAALVLAGTLLLSRGLAERPSLFGGLGVTAVAEVYSVALVGGAALLMHIGQRRSAVMLSLLAMFYQGDLTLHTDTSPELGAAGALASAAWLGLFAAKLSALARAMKLRLSKETWAALALGGLGLSALPFCLPALSPRAASGLVMLWLFALSSLQGAGSVVSSVELDAWGQTVLRRSLRVTWALFAGLTLFHVVFWSTQGLLNLALLSPLVPALMMRRLRAEGQVWATSAATLLVFGAVLPASLSAAALLLALTLGLRAASGWNQPPLARQAEQGEAGPYRAGAAVEATVDEPGADLADDPATVRRWAIGAALSLYLSLWTLGWTGGAFPAHVLPLDVVLTAAAVAGARGLRTRAAFAPAPAVWAHFVWQARLVPVPTTLQQWGVVAVASGFALLGGALTLSYRLRHATSRPAPEQSL